MVKRTPRKLKRQKLANITSRIGHAPSGALKCLDTVLTTVNFIDTGTFFLCNAVIEGTDLFQRIGRKIYMKSIQIRGHIYCTGTVGQDMIRVILLHDSQANAAAPTFASLLADSNGGGATNSTSFINMNNRERFVILRDLWMNVPSATFAGAAPQITNPGFQDPLKSMNLDWFIPLKGLMTTYNANNNGNVGDIQTGSLYLCFIQVESAASEWSINLQTRLRYYDT